VRAKRQTRRRSSSHQNEMLVKTGFSRPDQDSRHTGKKAGGTSDLRAASGRTGVYSSVKRRTGPVKTSCRGQGAQGDKGLKVNLHPSIKVEEHQTGQELMPERGGF